METHLTVALVAVFASVALATGLVASRVLAARSPERRRLRQLIRPAEGAGQATVSLLLDRPNELVGRLGRWVPQLPSRLTRVRPRLEALGYHGSSALIVFSAIELLSAIAAGMMMLFLLGFHSWGAAAIAAGVGFVIPNAWLNKKFRQRQKLIRNGLPDTLDLCVICLEAGCSLDHAISKASDELTMVYPELAEELRLLRAEAQAGKPKIEAFKNFAERTQIDEVRALVAMLVQTERFGTSVAQALRLHAEAARHQRRQRAEERAAKAGVKLVFPLVCFLFPAFYVVTLGPAMLQFLRAFADGLMPALK